ncbi:hypothetical protein LTR56_010954 [Elasticomyces elasticus]|nr:hypothetical protein LTR56_010954 [Elasticomyces elasticus]KAK3662652.1 hypothetical protein LTR22_006502 [Elasticomyces elasticus]KAK4926564.1 hypothetical protein LTR49_006498 [Elasticomyces elasticus]KAK5760657.1 hypothetical protein LTS12_009194 [Elasticomyces elasticus]
MVDAVNDFGLSTGSMRSPNAADIPGASLSVYDGTSFVYVQESDNLTWWESAAALWKWGFLAPYRTKRLMKSVTGRFDKMYDEPHFPFASLTRTATELDLLDVTASTGEQYISDNGITGAFGHDVIQASTRVNYAQNLRYINGLLAMVCMATDGAMSVENGNWQIFDEMIKAANATPLLGTAVTSIDQRSDGRYSLQHSCVAETSSTDSARSDTFDAVVLAAPYQFTNITLDDDIEHVPSKIPYVQLHVTLLTSPHLLSPAFFDMPPGKAAPKVILTTLPPNEEPQEGVAGVGSPGFFSISLLAPITNPKTGGEEYLYKIFSPQSPNSTFLASLLGFQLLLQDHDQDGISEEDITWIYRKVWNSYPYEVPRSTFEEIQLDSHGGGLWYTSAMDGFISTMETNALSGKNVARLVVDRWQQRLLNGTTAEQQSAPVLLASGGLM